MPARSVIEETKVARYKVLKSVAHNIGHSFTSLMNYAGDDYVMGHILRLARLTGQDTLTIDFVAGNAAPVELLQEPISEIPAQYTRFFWSLVETHGSDRTYVKAVQMSVFVVRAFVRLREMLATNRRLAGKIAELENRLDTHDSAIQDLIEAIKELMTPKERPRRRIGFQLPPAKANG
jgi:hypothetical protein